MSAHPSRSRPQPTASSPEPSKPSAGSPPINRGCSSAASPCSSDSDLESFRRDLDHDAQVIAELLAGVRPVTPEHDLKLQSLTECISDKVKTPLNPGNRKVLIFSAFTDTADYLYRELTPRLRELGLSAAVVTGTGSPRTTLGKGFGFQQVLTLFSPRSKSRHLVLPDETRDKRASLEQAGVATTGALAVQSEPVAGIRIERVARLRQQASLQVLARERPNDKPPFALIEPGDDPVWGHGFEQLPAPDPADVFLDYEGHPFWRPERGLFFLFGYLIADESGEWGYHALGGGRSDRAGPGRGAGPVPDRSPPRRPGHARVPLQPHRAVSARSPLRGARRR